MKKIIALFLCIFTITTCQAQDTYDVLTFGGILIDYLIPISHEDLEKLSLEKGSWKLCEMDQIGSWLALSEFEPLSPKDERFLLQRSP